MKSKLTWIQGMKFEALTDGQTVSMDAKAPIGSGSAQTPKELVAAGLAGCTGVDVVSLLKKHKQPFTGLEMEVDIETSKGVYPAVFTKALLTFSVQGPVDPQILKEAVHLSQTKYCGVSAMLVKAFPIFYRVLLNGEEISNGQADFSQA